MTSFCPSVPQSFDALKAAPPPGFQAQIDSYGRRLWLSLVGRRGALAVLPMAGPGVELIRYHDAEPNAVLQALADHWRCPIVCRHDGLEGFEPRI